MGLKEKFLAPSPKKMADKTLLPEETISLVEGRLKQAGTEIFKELRRVDKGRLGIPVYMSLYGTEGLSLTKRLKQMGKGSTEALAQASALMELVERYSLFKWVKKGDFRRGYLDGKETISVNKLLDSVEDPERDEEARRVAADFLSKIPFHLAKALALPQKREISIPFYWFWLLYEFNGSAAGNTYAEAAVQGLCELIERHASALSTWLPGPFEEVVLDELSAEVASLKEAFDRLGIKLFIRNFTFGLPVPTIGVLAYDPSTFPHRSEIVYTAGTATHPERALVRALTEVAQLAGDFDTDGKYLESGLPKFSNLEEAEIIIQAQGQVKLSELPNLWRADHAEELVLLTEALSQQGLESFFLDLAIPELNLPVVYVVVPGMHFRERLFLSPLYQLVRTLALYHPLEEALSLLEEIDQKIDRYYVSAYLGQLWMRKGLYEEACKAFEKALALAPPPEDEPAIYCQWAYAELQRGRYKSAEEVALKGVSRASLPELFNILGTAYFKQKRLPEALEAYMQAVELNPEGAVDYANVGACLVALGLKKEAERFFESAHLLDPTLDLEPYRKATL